MKNRIMMGLWRYMISVPPFLWEKQIAKGKMAFAAHLAFMSPEHRLVHHFTVRELPRTGTPMQPEFISEALSLPLGRVMDILEDLESHMTFIFRNKDGHVHWAYPVTTEKTPHHVTFDTGEKIHAA